MAVGAQITVKAGGPAGLSRGEGQRGLRRDQHVPAAFRPGAAREDRFHRDSLAERGEASFQGVDANQIIALKEDEPDFRVRK